jgi:hypothetical protein
MTRRLEIVVDELVVRGLSPEDARVAATALESRLATLATLAGVAPRPRAEAFRRLPAVAAPAHKPAAVGAAVAGAVWSNISGSDKR